MYDYSARYMEPAIGRFISVDPLAEKYYSWSPYAYVGNNPINASDPTGMGWYIFNSNDGETGKCNGDKRKADGEHRMAVRTVDKDGNIHYKFHDFNDPIDDAQNIENGNITDFASLASGDIESLMQNAGVYDQTSFSRLSYLMDESNAGNLNGTGKLDFKVTAPQLNSNTLQIIDGVAYNNSDAGNYLWGYAARKLGLAEWSARSGAHANAWWSAKESNGEGSSSQSSIVKWFEDRSWRGDSSGDQRAIKKGMKAAGPYWQNEWRMIKKTFK